MGHYCRDNVDRASFSLSTAIGINTIKTYKRHKTFWREVHVPVTPGANA